MAELDPDSSTFAMPTDYAGAQPSALQALLNSYLLPGQIGSPASTPAPAPAVAPAGPVSPLQSFLSSPQATNAGPTAPTPAVAAAAPNPVNVNPGLPMLNMQPAPTPGQVAMHMPTPPAPRNVPTWAKALGVLSALAGGPGAAMVNQYTKQGDASDQQQYGMQMQQYQMQQQEAQKAQANQQQQTQQQFDNQQAQQKSYGDLTRTLSGMDDGSQQQLVSALMKSPAQLAIYGQTPETMKAQFFDGKGNFTPIEAQQTAKDSAALLRTQTTARERLYQMTTDAQQNLHDQMAPDDWENATGIPYKDFTPGQITSDVTKMSAEQSKANVDSAQAQLATARASGISKQIEIAQDRVNEAVRNDNLVNQSKAAAQQVTKRGQDFAHQDRQASNRTAMSRVQIDNIRATELNRLTNIKIANANSPGGASPIKNLISATTQLANATKMRDQALAQLNNTLNPPDDEAAAELHGQVDQYNKVIIPLWTGKVAEFRDQASGIKPKGSVAPVSPGVTNGYGLLPPGVSPLPSFTANPSYGGNGGHSQPQAPRVQQPPAQRPVHVVSGTFAGHQVSFHAPTTKAEFDAMTPLKRQAYMQYLQQTKGVRHR